ncbi:hypothetical protein TMCG_00618, partial [Mycobacterium tuberculosis SUMu003]
ARHCRHSPTAGTASAAGAPVASVHTRIRSHRGVYPLT